MKPEKLLFLRRSLLSLKEVLKKREVDTDYNYEFCRLSNSIRDYALAMHDYPQLILLMDDYPLMQIKYFKNVLYSTAEYIYEKVPVYYSSPPLSVV